MVCHITFWQDVNICVQWVILNFCTNLVLNVYPQNLFKCVFTECALNMSLQNVFHQMCLYRICVKCFPTECVLNVSYIAILSLGLSFYYFSFFYLFMYLFIFFYGYEIDRYMAITQCPFPSLSAGGRLKFFFPGEEDWELFSSLYIVLCSGLQTLVTLLFLYCIILFQAYILRYFWRNLGANSNHKRFF